MTEKSAARPPNPKKLFPLVITARLEETKRFYQEKAGFRVVYDLPAYLQVVLGDEDGPELCFMKPDAFSDGVARPPFDGQGLVVSIPTPDADRKYAELSERGVPLLSEPSIKPWGWRSFLAQDPNGVVLDFFHVETAPAM